jgi:hypothetical protein
MTINNEYLESLITKWAENLWLLNNQSRISDEKSKEVVSREFHQRFYPNNNRGLTPSQGRSERNFTRLIYGLVHLESVAPKFSEAVSRGSLVDAWRRRVWKNHFQQRYDFFESCLKETIDKSGVDAAIAQYPKGPHSGVDVVGTLEYMNYTSKLLDQKIVRDLVQQAETRNTPPKGPDTTPKGP